MRPHLIAFVAALILCNSLDVAAAETGPQRERTTAERASRGRGRRIAGTVLTVLGAGLALTSWMPYAFGASGGPQHCLDGSPCDLGYLVAGAGMGLTSAVVLAVGIPLIASGVSEEQAARRNGPIVDSIGLRALPGGGGFAVSGRF